MINSTKNLTKALKVLNEYKKYFSTFEHSELEEVLPDLLGELENSTNLLEKLKKSLNAKCDPGEHICADEDGKEWDFIDAEDSSDADFYRLIEAECNCGLEES